MSQTVSIRLDEDVVRKLDALTKVTERSRSWLMAQAVEQYVEHEAWQIEAIRNTLDTMRQGQAGFASHEETLRWLGTWGDSSESPEPACR